ncbi:hypothetical protein CY652_07840 [Burkholderia sp. WAC0059]|nr:hypothetical protein CY652_07840 [Burkholderia sp. WAC0059]
MKLSRFAKIRGYRIFRDFIWPKNLEDFGRFNLVYGWNGSGKTTLSGLFKPLQLSAPIVDGDVDFVFDETSVSGRNLSQVALPPVRVFNRDTIARSVFETSSGVLGQLPPVYVFGEESAEKQRHLDELKPQLSSLADAVTTASASIERAQKELNDYATATARAIKNLLVAPRGSFNNYNAANFRENIARISSSTKQLLSVAERESLLGLKDAQPLPAVRVGEAPSLNLLGLRNEVRQALQKTVVSNVIGQLAANPGVSAWVRDGLSIHAHEGDAEVCMFCGQPLLAERLRRLEAHFNDEFRRFTQDLQALANRIERTAAGLNNVALVDSKDLYPELRPEYDDACLKFEASLENVRRGLLGLADAVKEKQFRVFEVLDLDSFAAGESGIQEESKSFLSILLGALDAGLNAVGEFMGQRAFASIMSAAQKHNEKTQSFSKEIESIRERLHNHELAVALDGWLELQSQIKSTTEVHSRAKGRTAEVEKQIRVLEAAILEHRQPADDLNRELYSYLGHDEIQVAVEDTGYRLVRRGGAATNLSEGERTAIAFLYFLKSLEDRSFDLRQGIVVVDDPISSLDSNSVYSAFGFMKRKLSDAGQLFVLTHNYTFLRQVRNWFQHVNSGKKVKPAKFYMLRASYSDGQRSSILETMDRFLQDYESEYHYLFKRIFEASEIKGGGALQTYYELPNLARRLLEAFLIFKVPDEATLHARLEAVEFDGHKKTRILRFVDTHSHAEQIGEGHDDVSALSEAPNVLKELLELIEACDKGHFYRMKQSLSER